MAYGNGRHTKHHHTRYHDFFTDRVRSGERVFDIGCGLGAVAHAVANKSAAHIVAFDLDLGNIAKARKLFSHPNVMYFVGDALGEIPGEKYDVVILSNVLEHLTERDWRVHLKRELGVEWRLDSTHETEYTIESFTKEVNEAGLCFTHMETRWGEIWSEVGPVPW